MENGNTSASLREPASRLAARAIARAAASSAPRTGARESGEKHMPPHEPDSGRGPPVLPSADEQWKNLARQLGEALAALNEGEFLIVAIRGTNLYVQFVVQESFRMRAEATSSHYPPDDARLDDDQHRALLGMRWRPPTHLPDGVGPQVPEGSPNYFFDVPPLDTYGYLAQMAVMTLNSVFGATDVQQFEYTASVEDGASIRFATLGIPMSER